MKSSNIVKKLQKEGYKVIYKKWSYWDGVPHVEFERFDFAIAEHVHENGWMGCNLDFIFSHVQEALYMAEKNNPIFFKKIEQVPWEKGYYGRYVIHSMDDYYDYLNGVYPFNEYYKVLEKLKKEI